MKKIMVLVSMIIIAALLSGCIVTGGNDNRQTVSSSGTATLHVMPDKAYVSIAIETLEKSAEASKDANAEITDAVQAALAHIGLPKENIETEYYNINEEYDWSNNIQKSKGFRTSNTLRVKAPDFKDVGMIVDAAVDAGATRIQGITFDLSDAKKSELKKQSLADASKDAREKAEAIASGLGADLGKIVSVSDTSYDYTPYMYLRAPVAADMAKAEVASTDISPQQLEVHATVQVVFEIG